MEKRPSANVVDLGAFSAKQRTRGGERPVAVTASAVVVPVWFCWVPVWGPIVG